MDDPDWEALVGVMDRYRMHENGYGEIEDEDFPVR